MPQVIEAGLGATSQLVEFVSGTPTTSLPDIAIEGSKSVLLDTLACIVGGWNLPSSRIVRSIAVENGGRPESTLVVTGERLPAAATAYIHGHLANALDADDTLNNAGHIAAPIVAAALSIGERAGASGADVLGAICLAYEAVGRIAMSLQTLRITDEGGFSFAPVTGYGWATYGAAIAAARLLGLNSEQMSCAFGLAAMSSPLPTSGRFGAVRPRPMAKYGLYGLYAHSGVMAAMLAERGFTADPSSLDGDRGLWRMTGSLSSDWAALTTGIGSRWLINEASYKLYPACRFLAPAVDLFLNILRKEAIDPVEIDRVEAEIPSPAIVKGMGDSPAGSMVDGCFSLPYLFGAAAFGGPPGPAWHTDELRRSERVADLAAKVNVKLSELGVAHAQEDMRTLGRASRFTSSVTVWSNGRSFQATTEYARGDADSPTTRIGMDEARVKFCNFSHELLSPTAAERVCDSVAELGTAENLRDLIAALTSLPARWPDPH